MKFIFISALLSALQINLSYTSILKNEEQILLVEEGVWGPMLEEWTINAPKSSREKRVMRIDNEQQILIETNSTKKKHEEKQGKIYNNKIVNTNYNQPPYSKPPKQVSETDLYLLGAIEKLVYKVDTMEKRLRRVEEMLYFVTAGNRIDQDPCPDNYTRVGMNCYYFAASAGREYDWKAASKQCKKIGAVLAEFETIEENQDIVAHIQATHYLRGKDFWTGGLNPGLLWIWSNSARPVSTNNKQNNQSNGILGDGRCLKISYNPAIKSYAYKGSDCSMRNHYICEQPETTSSNEIKRIGRKLNIFKDEL